MPAAIVTEEMAGQDLVAWAIALSEESYQLVVDDMTQEHRVISLTSLYRAIQTSSLSLVEVLRGGDQPFCLTSDQLTVVRETARRQFPLRDIVRGLRIVQRHWTEVLLDLAERRLPPSKRPERSRELLEVLTRFFDDTIDSVMVEYLAERQRLLGSALSSRRETVMRLLAGEDPEDAEELLGVKLAHHHLALALPNLGDHLEQPGCEGACAPALLDDLVGALRATSQLLVPGFDHEQWAWVGSERPFATGHPGIVAEVLAAHGHHRAGLGRPRPGREGLCESLADARDALRLARLRPAARVVAFEEAPLAALLSANAPRARSFVQDELGELAADQPAMAELRATLRTYYECEQSLVKTASRLFLHRNTVVYRLRRIEQLLGHPVGLRALELHAALELAAQLCEGLPD